MCRWLYVSQLRFLVTTGALDILCFFTRIYSYNIDVDISGWSASSSIPNAKAVFLLPGFILDCMGCLIPASAMFVMSLLMLANCCQNYRTSRLQTGEFYAEIGLGNVFYRLIAVHCDDTCIRL